MKVQQAANPLQKLVKQKGQIILQPEMKSALFRSGYLIEYRVTQVLQDYGYYADANSVYIDPISGITRELDIHALCAHTITPKRIDPAEFFFSVLSIECINNPQPLVFFTREPAADFLQVEKITTAGCPKRILQSDGTLYTPLTEYLDLDKYHHYCKGSFATQFCTFTKKQSGQNKGEWMACGGEGNFDSLRTTCVAAHYLASQYQTLIDTKDSSGIGIEFYYPILVVGGKLMEAIPLKRSIRLKSVNHIKYRQILINGNREQNYIVDVVTEKFLPKLLTMIETEMNKATNKVRHSYDRFVEFAQPTK